MQRTFLPRLPPPPFFLLCDALNPLMSSSKIIDGGLTFLPHPWVWLGSVGPEVFLVDWPSFSESIRTGAAKTTAVDENAAVTAAPTGSRAAPALGFCA